MTENNAPLLSGRQNTTMAIIAYLVFFIPLLTGDAKKDSFVNYHTKQGLVLFLLAVVLNAMNWIIPYYFWYSINWILSLGMLVLLIIGISNAANGKKQPLPVIGQFADNFKF